jgi:hypothetical protein
MNGSSRADLHSCQQSCWLLDRHDANQGALATCQNDGLQAGRLAASQSIKLAGLAAIETAWCDADRRGDRTLRLNSSTGTGTLAKIGVKP